MSEQNVYIDYSHAIWNEYTREMTSQIVSDFQAMENNSDIYKWSNDPITDADTAFCDYKKEIYKLACL
jgi:hypothetical protein